MLINTQFNGFYVCTHTSWWLVLGWVTTKEYHPCIRFRNDLLHVNIELHLHLHLRRNSQHTDADMGNTMNSAWKEQEI